MTENLHGGYEKTIAELKDIADGGARKRAEDRRGVNKLLELSKQAPARTEESGGWLVNEALRQVRR